MHILILDTLNSLSKSTYDYIHIIYYRGILKYAARVHNWSQGFWVNCMLICRRTRFPHTTRSVLDITWTSRMDTVSLCLLWQPVQYFLNLIAIPCPVRHAHQTPFKVAQLSTLQQCGTIGLLRTP